MTEPQGITKFIVDSPDDVLSCIHLSPEFVTMVNNAVDNLKAYDKLTTESFSREHLATIFHYLKFDKLFSMSSQSADDYLASNMLYPHYTRAQIISFLAFTVRVRYQSVKLAVGSFSQFTKITLE